MDAAARIVFLNRHIGAVRRTLSAGVPLKGYIVWSLLDNSE
ncbi:family 1 glycosylhydrolase [Nitratireductor sp.]|nr:family 1 glycosylhydrolase [Nitratireductor sp.]